VSQKQRQQAERRRRARIRWGVVAAIVALIALGGVLFLPIDDDGGPAPVEISMVEYAFAPSAAVAEPGQELAIANDGAISHSYLIVDLAKGLELAAGADGSLLLPSDVEPGTYEVICDLPGHVEEGMVGTLEIG
jgi:plastocyanin